MSTVLAYRMVLASVVGVVTGLTIGWYVTVNKHTKKVIERLFTYRPRPPTWLWVYSFPHEFQKRSRFRFRICNQCYAPKSLHPRTEMCPSRPLHDNAYYSADAPHFKEGW